MNDFSKKVFIAIIIMVVISLPITAVFGRKPVFAATSTLDVDTAILRAVAYFQTQQNDDGGLRWIDEASSVPATIRVVLALAAAGFPQEMLSTEQGNSPMDYLAKAGHSWVFQTEETEPVLNIARAGQLLTAVAAANQDPYYFGSESINLVHLLMTHYDPNTGVYGTATPENVTDQVWAILGLASAYAGIPRDAVTWLGSAQSADGSWDDGFGSTLDMTPLVVMALMASDYVAEDAPEIMQAIDFMISQQQPDGGWQSTWDSSTNANITGMILQAIYAAGQSPSDPAWVKDEGSPVTALLNLQGEDGAIGGDFTNTYSTADAVLGLVGQPLFDLGHLRQIGRAFEYIFTAQGDDGGWGSVGQTIDVIIAARAAGWDANTLLRKGHSPLDFIADHLDEYLGAGPDAIGKAIIGLVAAGQDPTNFHGVDLVKTLTETYSQETGAFGDPENTWHQALAILGLHAAQATIPDGAVQTLRNLQQADGGWEYSPGFGTWSDNTSIALQALLAARTSTDDKDVQNGLAYILSQQFEDGGWGDSSTTAYAIMALNTAGMDPDLWQTESGKTPINNLMTFQVSSGAFFFSQAFPDENLMATSAAILAALSGDYLIRPLVQVTENTAGLVVQSDQGEVTTACVAIEGDYISGLALLEASGIPYQAQDGFMNSILGISNPQGGTMYWSYWHWDGREWVFNNIGAGDSQVLPGSIEAWYFTSWEVYPSLPPAFVPQFGSLCESSVPKNFAVQPFLHYYDLFEGSLSTSGVTQLAAGQQLQPTTQESLSLTPIIIIGVAGLVVLGLIIWVLFRKK